MDSAKQTQLTSEGHKNTSPHKISIWLDEYDDIFSDFDPRNFSVRNTSDDFLEELKKVSRENDADVNELKLLIPEKNRTKENEIIIIRRLHSHFTSTYQYYRNYLNSDNKKGVLFTISGMGIIALASYISLQKSEMYLMHTLLMIFEPAGWFLSWTGLDILVNASRKQKQELNFYRKMMNAKIVFENL